LVIKTLDTDWILNGIQPKKLDPNLDPDPKHTVKFLKDSCPFSFCHFTHFTHPLTEKQSKTTMQQILVLFLLKKNTCAKETVSQHFLI
jgi:hypothetical protein